LTKKAFSRSQQNGRRWTLSLSPELVRDIIKWRVQHQCYTKRLEQRKSDPNVNVHAVDKNLEEEL